MQPTNISENPSSQDDTINELFAKHYKASFRPPYKILRSREDSEDAAQTAYCAAFRHFHRFRGESSFLRPGSRESS
jgi:DNA-directed RNA polymerase specialized sigma24 family protein